MGIGSIRSRLSREFFYLDPWRKETAMRDLKRKDKCYVDPGENWLDPDPTIERIFFYLDP